MIARNFKKVKNCQTKMTFLIQAHIYLNTYRGSKQVSILPFSNCKAFRNFKNIMFAWNYKLMRCMLNAVCNVILDWFYADLYGDGRGWRGVFENSAKRNWARALPQVKVPRHCIHIYCVSASIVSALQQSAVYTTTTHALCFHLAIPH